MLTMVLGACYVLMGVVYVIAGIVMMFSQH